MSAFTYIAFQRPLPAYRFGDIKGREKEFGIMYDTKAFLNSEGTYCFPGNSHDVDFGIGDVAGVTFRDCFVNPFVYEFTMDPCRDPRTRQDSIYHEILESGKSIKFLLDRYYRIGLCDFIRRYATPGDTVELYEEFGDHRYFNFGPPARSFSFALLEYIIEYDDANYSDFFAEIDKTKISLLVE